MGGAVVLPTTETDIEGLVVGSGGGRKPGGGGRGGGGRFVVGKSDLSPLLSFRNKKKYFVLLVLSYVYTLSLPLVKYVTYEYHMI